MSPLRHLIVSVFYIAVALVGFALIGFCGKARAEPLTIGLHIGSVHLPAKDYLSNGNPGVYLRQGALQGGIYLNSYRRTTLYGGGVLPVGQADLMFGLATGYDKRCSEHTTTTPSRVETTTDCKGWSRHRIAPLVAVSWSPAIDVLGSRPRLWFVPGFAATSSLLHLSLERSF